jgi:hypothetical protein
VCGEEALINEEIIDVTIGTLKFYGDYQGGMPTIAVPAVMAIRWSMSSKANRSPEGRWLDD